MFIEKEKCVILNPTQLDIVRGNSMQNKTTINARRKCSSHVTVTKEAVRKAEKSL